MVDTAQTQVPRRYARGQGTWILVVVTMAIFGMLLLATFTTTHAQHVESLKEDRSTYYRLKVKLAYKGEAQDFDIVVGCNVREIFYKESGSTYEVGLIPSVFGRRMSDGKGLVVRPPNACRGETTANGRVQPDLLPVVVVYENAETLDFGIAYLSEDAYESPLSVLKFGGATIEKASRAEFDEFRRTQTNLVTRQSYHSALSAPDVLKKMKVTPAPNGFAHVCEGYTRYRLSPELRALVSQYWPEGRPRYWATSYDSEGSIWQAIYKRQSLFQSDRTEDPPHRPWTFGQAAADRGLPTRNGGGMISAAPGREFSQAYYPAASDYRLDRWPTDKRNWSAYIKAVDKIADMHVDFREGATRGFAYCYVRVFPDSGLQASLSGKRLFGRLDGEDVAAMRAPSGPSFVPGWIMERNEYAFHFFRINLESTRGDV
jgi:hypothetical protein